MTHGQTGFDGIKNCCFSLLIEISLLGSQISHGFGIGIVQTAQLFVLFSLNNTIELSDIFCGGNANLHCL